MSRKLVKEEKIGPPLKNKEFFHDSLYYSRYCKLKQNNNGREETNN
jgi:hypothetical protein